MATKNLVEAYKNRLDWADTYYAKNHNGAKMDSYKKLLIATSLNNVSNFLNESFENSAGTQRAALGDFKKFCLTLTNLALPNMIAPELVLTVPMASRTGFVTYINYVAGSNKGDVKRGDLFNGTYALGDMTDARANYTGQRVVQTADHTTGTATDIFLAWTPVIADATGDVEVEVIDQATGLPLDSSKWEVGKTTTAGYDKRFQLQDDLENQGASILIAPNDTVNSAKYEDQYKVTIKSTTDTGKYIVKYVYDNIVIPQNDIPQLNARLEEVTLAAHARRIAVTYSQIAQFQAKTDYGFDLGDNLAKQAIGELQYEIDSEIVAGLATAVDPATVAAHQWSKTPGIGVSLVEHYQGFAKIFDELATEIYLVTKKFTPNYMVCARDVITVLSFLNGWNAAPLGQINGPYFAGSFNGVKVFVSPMLKKGTFFVGVNGSDMQTSAAVYGVYMPCVPTQLLGFADGAMSQGFSTLYDFQILSKYEKNGHFYSPLLAGGAIVD